LTGEPDLEIVVQGRVVLPHFRAAIEKGEG
jgi:hypothetical protein